MLRFIALLAVSTLVTAQQVVQSVDVPVASFNTVLIQADAGNLVLKSSGVKRVRGELRYSVPVGTIPQNSAVLTEIKDSILIIRAPQAGPSSAPIQFVLEIPKDEPVAVVGPSLAIKAEGLESPLKIQTLSGNVEIVDPTGPTTVDSNSGNIVVTLGIQPKEDLRFQTDSGFIKLSIDDGLSLKAHLKSGSLISWGTGMETSSGSFERALGRQGPLLFASSRSNKISADLVPSHLSGTNPLIFTAEAQWVYMNVIVRDQVEQTIPSLHRESFQVTDNGLPVKLGHFESTTQPFHLLLLFDVSGSIKPHASLIRESARQFIRRSRNGDEFAIATFSSNSRLIQPFTNDVDLAEKALNSITPSGGTALYDAVHKSITEYMGAAVGRKAIVLFTDGIDNNLWGSTFGSTRTFQDLLSSVKETDSLIYPIFVQPLPDPEWQATPSSNAKPTSIAELLATVQGKRREVYCSSETSSRATPVPCPVDPYQVIATGENNLSQLAEQTGGRLYRLRRIEDLASTYKQIANDLDTVYTLGFAVQRVDSHEWHELAVRVRDFPLAIVRTRQGYYSPGPKE